MPNLSSEKGKTLGITQRAKSVRIPSYSGPYFPAFGLKELAPRKKGKKTGTNEFTTNEMKFL